MIKKACIRVAALVIAVFACSLGCSNDPSVGCFYVEIAPAKFVPVKFTDKFRTDMIINYDGKVVTFKLPRDSNSPSSLMEFQEKLYVLALDASARWRSEWQWRCYQQDGDHFKEVPAKDFPKSIAIMNIWRPGIPGRYSTGMRSEDKIDETVLNCELDPENKYFVNSYQARLWFMLEIENNLEKAEREFFGEQAKTFLLEYIAKYNPVRLTSMELKPVPKDECNF